ncbi:alpha/beta fold hydrolase [Rugamonas sp. FT82W]|uniref:Alpha/beta fold hydrolase n=1 Tax=Duganella vulcania TaxID=2692166 RepID=A0A845G6T5_9BURK|nr:alpha/beta fold hydrolase [Duganella vulcania]MYM88647.1 alpha/beta fold hydrolase [Duganella vulcania]
MSIRIPLTLALALPLAAAAEAPPQQYADLGNVHLESGAVIKDCKLGYRTLGSLNAARSNAVVFLPWHTGKSVEAVSLLGPKGLFNTAGRYVIVVDAIGNGVACSPSNSATQHGTAFPAFTVRDMVESEYRLLTEKLGLKHVHAVVGYSMGATQTFQWMVSHPGFMDVAVPIAGTPRQTSYDLLFWRTEEAAMLADPDYANGEYKQNPKLPLYHQIFSLNFDTPAYRAAQTKPAEVDKFIAETIADDPDAADANDMRWQMRAFLTQDIGDDAAAKVKARVHIINPRQDLIVNPTPALAFARRIRAATTVLEGACGHSAVVCATAQIRAAVDRALK